MQKRCRVAFEILVQIFVGTLPDDISEPLVSTKKLRFNFDSDSIPHPGPTTCFFQGYLDG